MKGNGELLSREKRVEGGSEQGCRELLSREKEGLDVEGVREKGCRELLSREKKGGWMSED